MGYSDYSDTWLIALTREKRALRRAPAASPATLRFSSPRQAMPELRQLGPRRSNRNIRCQIWNEGRRKCHYCEAAMTLTMRNMVIPDNLLTIDHKTPLSRGGPDAWENIVGCCYVCNQIKGDRTEAEYRKGLISPTGLIPFSGQKRKQNAFKILMAAAQEKREASRQSA